MILQKKDQKSFPKLQKQIRNRGKELHSNRHQNNSTLLF